MRGTNAWCESTMNASLKIRGQMRQNHYKLMFIKTRHWTVSSTSPELIVYIFLSLHWEQLSSGQNWAGLEGCGILALLNCTNEVLKGDKKDTASIQSFSSVALIGFTCLILYKHSKRLINKDKSSTVNIGTFLCPQGYKGRWKETLLMSESWEGKL